MFNCKLDWKNGILTINYNTAKIAGGVLDNLVDRILADENGEAIIAKQENLPAPVDNVTIYSMKASDGYVLRADITPKQGMALKFKSPDYQKHLEDLAAKGYRVTGYPVFNTLDSAFSCPVRLIAAVPEEKEAVRSAVKEFNKTLEIALASIYFNDAKSSGQNLIYWRW